VTLRKGVPGGNERLDTPYVIARVRLRSKEELGPPTRGPMFGECPYRWRNDLG